MPRDLTTNQKYRFEVSSSLLSNNKSFLNWILMCDEKWILLDNWRWPVQWLDWKEAPKHFPKPNLHQKKGHCRCLVVCFCSDAPQFRESQWNHYIWEVCSANRWDAPKTATSAASIGQQKGLSFSPRQHLTTCHTTNPSKVEWSGLEALPHSPPSPDLSPTDYHFFKHLDSFSEGKCFHQQWDAENAFQEITESRSMGFYATGVNKLISCWQKCVDWNGSYFD